MSTISRNLPPVNLVSTVTSSLDLEFGLTFSSKHSYQLGKSVPNRSSTVLCSHPSIIQKANWILHITHVCVLLFPVDGGGENLPKGDSSTSADCPGGQCARGTSYNLTPVASLERPAFELSPYFPQTP